VGHCAYVNILVREGDDYKKNNMSTDMENGRGKGEQKGKE
jgi:hypothetical protein